MLFIATLGVYLGLFIAGGAAPQVFAHSATTRGFEISDEVEVKDDLDKKPGESTQSFRAFGTAEAEHVVRASVIRFLDQFAGALDFDLGVPEQCHCIDPDARCTFLRPIDNFQFRSTENFKKQFGLSVKLPRAALEMPPSKFAV